MTHEGIPIVAGEKHWPWTATAGPLGGRRVQERWA
jgi:hypothetical protein